MPKKMGINSKAVESRERKATAKKSANEKAVRAAEDRLWEDNDKTLAKKQNRKEEEERKKAEQLRKKAEARALLEQESAALKPPPKQASHKITQAEIRAETEKRNKAIETAHKPIEKLIAKVIEEDPLEENLNRALADTNFASGIDEAISVLSVDDSDADKHPEKRMKAAFKAFEAENLNRIKLENPTLRLSQWKQLLFREWEKSPQNPLNANRK